MRKGFTNIWKKRGLQLVHFVFYKWYLRFTSTLRFDQLNLDNNFFSLKTQRWLFQSMYCPYRNGKGLPRRSQCVTGVKGWKSFIWLGAQVGPFWTSSLDPSLFVDYNNECTFCSYLTNGLPFLVQVLQMTHNLIPAFHCHLWPSLRCVNWHPWYVGWIVLNNSECSRIFPDLNI